MSEPRYTLCGLVVLTLLLSCCATRLPASYYPRSVTTAFQDTSDTQLGRVYEPLARPHVGESGFHLLPTGPEALMMRIALIDASQRSVDLQYFSARDDATGKLLLEALARAADRGVRVRMLLDGWNLDDFESSAVSLNVNPNLEIRVFNPYSSRDESFFAHFGNVFSDMDQFTRRMHNKAIIADNQIAIMGGRNLGDEYFGADQNINFRDTDVFIAGPLTRKISNNFDTYWNSDQAFPIPTLNLPPSDAEKVAALREEMKAHWQDMMQSPTGKRLRALPLPHEVKKGSVSLAWAHADLAADTPDKVEQPADDTVSEPVMRIDQLVNKAQHEFIIFTPYFVPLDSGVDWLDALVARGVHVRIVTNSLASTDMVPAEAGYSHYREALVKGGVELYEIKSSQQHPSISKMFKPSSQNGLHSKIYMIDRQYLVIGSFNFDPRSMHLNTEQVLVIHSPELCAQIASLFAYVTSPASSYHLILANEVPPDEQSAMDIGDGIVWVTQEDGKTVYYDFNPHAGFWRDLVDNFFAVLPIDDQL